MQDTILNVNNITKMYGKKNIVLNDISFSMKKGEWVGIIGHNGAGKTTLLQIIAGLSDPTTGTIEFNDKYYEKKPNEIIGFQFQQTSYPIGITVKNMVYLALRAKGSKLISEKAFEKKNDTEKKNYILKSELKTMIEQYGLKKLYRKRANTLSGGERQKLNLIMSLINKPKFIIFDEFSTGLDQQARKEIIKEVIKNKEKQKSSGLVVSHHFEEIEQLCEYVVVLDKGNMINKTSVSDIVKKHGSISKYMDAILKGGA
ncbi:MAG: ABC transporter ATP-binding protein [Mycoplasmataceae bacterium]|nr:ABC transporter ATP-binding protein [Mycoplasmataceae bacterium]